MLRIIWLITFCLIVSACGDSSSKSSTVTPVTQTTDLVLITPTADFLPTPTVIPTQTDISAIKEIDYELFGLDSDMPVEILIAGYLPSSDSNSSPTNPNYIDYWSDMIGHINEEQLIPGVILKWEHISSDQHHLKYDEDVITALASNRYDVFQFQSDQFTNLPNLFDELQAAQLQQPQNISDFLYWQASQNGNIYGVPLNASLRSFLLDNSLFETQGWSKPNNLTDWAEFLNNRINEGYQGINIGLRDSWYYNLLNNIILGSFVNEQTQEKLLSGELCFTDAEFIDGYQSFLSLSNYFNENNLHMRYSDVEQTLGANYSILALDSFSKYSALSFAQAANEKLSLEFASLDSTNKVAVNAGSYFAIDKDTKHSNAAQAVINFFTSKVYGQLLINYYSLLPAISADYTFDQTIREPLHLESAVSALSRAQATVYNQMSRLTGTFEGEGEGFENRIRDAFHYLILGELTPHQFTQYVQNGLNLVDTKMASNCPTLEVTLPDPSSILGDSFDIDKIEWSLVNEIDLSGHDYDWIANQSEPELLYDFNVVDMLLGKVDESEFFSDILASDHFWWNPNLTLSSHFFTAEVQQIDGNNVIQVMPDGLETSEQYGEVFSAFNVRLPANKQFAGTHRIEIEVFQSGFSNCAVEIFNFDSNCQPGVNEGTVVFSNDQFKSSAQIYLNRTWSHYNLENAKIYIKSVKVFRKQEEVLLNQFSGVNLVYAPGSIRKALFTLKPDGKARVYDQNTMDGSFRMADLNYEVIDSNIAFNQSGQPLFKLKYLDFGSSIGVDGVAKLGVLSDWNQNSETWSWKNQSLRQRQSIYTEDVFKFEAGETTDSMLVNDSLASFKLDSDGFHSALAADGNYIKFLERWNLFISNNTKQSLHSTEMIEAVSQTEVWLSEQVEALSFNIDYQGKGELHVVVRAEAAFTRTFSINGGEQQSEVFDFNWGGYYANNYLEGAINNLDIYLMPLDVDQDIEYQITIRADEPDKVTFIVN